MIKIKLVDKSFSHNPECSFGVGDLKIKPTYFEWDRSGGNAENDIVVLTESCMQLVDMQQEKIKILLILEPYCISPYVYEKISKPENYTKFDYILTHSSDLLKIDKRFVSYIFGGCWINPEDRAVHQKTKNISIIASWKKDTEGQKLRHEIIDKFGDRIDVYGNGYKFVENKIEALKDYRYSIVVENEQSDLWMTEKLNDCFATGTIPVYWGAQSVGNYFNNDGIVRISGIDDLDYWISAANEEYYDECLSDIEDNFFRAKDFFIPEDRMYLNFFKPVFGL